MRSLPGVVAVLAIGLVVGCTTPPGGPVETQAAAFTTVVADLDELVAALPPLPEGDAERSAGGVARSAVALADALDAVLLPDGQPCPAERLEVLWSDPGPAYERGALAHPVGPEPDATTTLVNGAVVCAGSSYAYMGFTARWALERWIVLDIPAPDHDHEHLELALDPGFDDLAAVHADDVDLTPLWTRRWDAEIEGYAAYVPQRLCDPRPKPGTVAFTEMVLGAHPVTASWGISRPCHIGGTSEHKEGRAWDWRVDAHDDREREIAEQVVSWLMATDEYGNRHAMARRLGVMYVIWNRHIWSSALHDEGWRPYRGASPHTDHVHISFDPAGAMGRTSFWRGVPLGGLGLLEPFAGMPLAFPQGFSAPPSPADDGADVGHDDGAGAAHADSWERRDDAARDGRAPEADRDAGTAPAPDGAAGDDGDDGGDEPQGPGIAVPDVVPDVTEVVPDLPAPPLPSPSPLPQLPGLPGDPSDPLEDLDDLLDDAEDALRGALP